MRPMHAESSHGREEHGFSWFRPFDVMPNKPEGRCRRRGWHGVVLLLSRAAAGTVVRCGYDSGSREAVYSVLPTSSEDCLDNAAIMYVWYK